MRPNAVFTCPVHTKAGVCESRIGQSEVWVFVDGLLEQRYGWPDSVDTVTIAQYVPPLQIEIIGLHVLGGMSANSGLLFIRRLKGEGGGHGAVDLVFEGEHIARGSRELLAPDTLAGSGIVQTEGDAEFVACTLHTALQHQVDAQFTGQLGKRQIPGNCFVDCVSGRQVDFLQLKQLGTKSFSNAIGDIAQGFLVSNLFQRQDCNILPQFERGNALRHLAGRRSRAIQQCASGKDCQHNDKHGSGDPHPALSGKIETETRRTHDRMRNHLRQRFDADVGVGFPCRQLLQQFDGGMVTIGRLALQAAADDRAEGSGNGGIDVRS